MPLIQYGSFQDDGHVVDTAQKMGPFSHYSLEYSDVSYSLSFEIKLCPEAFDSPFVFNDYFVVVSLKFIQGLMRYSTNMQTNRQAQAHKGINNISCC